MSTRWIGLAAIALAIAWPPNDAPAQPSRVAFVDFNVVPMTRDTVLRHHTVLVAGGKITAVGPAGTLRVPGGVQRVEGGGTRFLLPALADMHTHATNPRELALFASHGVLTILNMAWSPDQFVALERLRYNSGELFGPTILEARRMNWPYDRTSGIATAAQGRDTVRYAKRIGYEFIKVYSFLADTVFDAIMQESAAAGITVIGHQTYGIGLSRAIRAGLRMVAHAEELGPSIGVPLTSAGADSTVRLFTEFGVWLTPTLSTFEAIANTWGNPTRLEQYIAEAEAAHVPGATVERWRRTNYHTQTGSVVNRLAAYTEITRRLHRVGVPMLAGTDGPAVPGMIPGVAIHDELGMLQSVGMSPYEALATATANAGRFVSTFVPNAIPFGSVTVGARADLLIVGANPIEDLSTLSRAGCGRAAGTCVLGRAVGFDPRSSMIRSGGASVATEAEDRPDVRPAASLLRSCGYVPTRQKPRLPTGTDVRAKRRFDIHTVLTRIREAVSAHADAAMFDLADRGFKAVFQQLVACIISIRTRDEVSLPVAIALLERAPTPEAMAKRSVAQIDALIHASSFHEAKAAQIHEIARRTVDEFGGELPCDFEVLTSFRGVGPKCANLTMGVACGAERISVDIHVHRVTNRWGYVSTASPEATMRALEEKLPRKYWVEINRLLVPFGKHICTGQLPKCSTCPVLEYCRQVGVVRHR